MAHKHVVSAVPPWLTPPQVVVEMERAKKPPPPPTEDVTAKRKAAVIPRHIIITWTWLGFLSVVCLVLSIIVWTSRDVPKERPQQERVVSAPSRHQQKVHAYPFNVYEATPGKVSRYPSGTSLGIARLSWDSVSWYRVCCKSNNVFQCFPTDAVALRKGVESSSVFLEIRHTPVNSSWEPLGSVGARCTLYWMDGKLSVEN